MKTLRAFNMARSAVWLITQNALSQILEISTREHLPDFEAVESARSKRKESEDRIQMRDGVAVIDITGPIFRYADWFTEISGAVSVQKLSVALNTALRDHAVKSILLNIDSPGGEASGINELAQMIFEGKKRKPIVAYVDAYCASAAYWIGSAADEIVTDATGLIGSIGVVATVPNPAARSAREVQFVSSQSPKKRPNPNTESGRQELQRIVDDLADVFVASVARNRGVSVQKVLDDFGQGTVLVGQNAIGAGLADRLGSFEQVVSELAAGKRARGVRATMSLADWETVKLGANAANIEAPSPAPMTEQRRRELLNASGLGRRILESE
jgi:capsid assembly protease